jgi:voltage-gated potassium channel
MRVPRTLRRSINRFIENPASLRTAAWAIVAAMVTAVVLGGVLIRLLDSKEYPNLGRAFWFTLQTVTTVGYGDVTPKNAVGRVIAAVVMLAGIGFITVFTAVVTSVLIAAEQRRRAGDGEGETAQPTADLAAISARLDQIEASLSVVREQTSHR